MGRTTIRVGTTAFAAAGDIAGPAFSDIAGHDAEGELTLMGALGIFSGDSGLGGAVNPDDPITRAQFCKVVVTAFGRSSTAAGLAGLQPTFTDGASIPSWAWGYVNVATYMGVINGYPDGSFGADNPVTYAEAVTMLIRAVSGHVAQVPAGVWPYNYLFYGVDNGFTGSVDVGFANLPCSRGDMAKLLFAAMQVNKLDTKGAELEDTAVLSGRLFEGTFDGTNVGTHTLALGDPVYIVGADDYDGLLGLNVVAVTKASKDVFLWKTEGSAIKGIFAGYDVNEVTDAWSIELEDGTKVPIDEPGSVGVVLNSAGGFSDLDLLEGDEITITSDDDGTAVSAVALRWDFVCWETPDVYGWDYLGSVTKSTDDTDTSVKFTGDYYSWFAPGEGWYDLDSGSSFDISKSAKVYINGALAGRDDLKVDDVVKAATYGGHGYVDEDSIIAVSATRNVVEGTITNSRTVFPGDHEYVTIKTGDTSKEYELDAVYGYFGSTALNTQHKFALAEDGLVFYDIEYSSALPFVIVTGASTETGSDTSYFITGDNKGETQSWEACPEDMGDSSWMVGWAYVLEIDGSTGLVEDYDEANDYGTATIMAIGDGTVTIDWGDGEYDFLETSLAYSDATGFTGEGESLADAEFIGLAGLSVGEEVTVLHSDDDTGCVFMLVRDDSPEED